jgi:hypothetical protein
MSILLPQNAGAGEMLTTLTSAKGITSTVRLPTTGTYLGKQAQSALIRVETASIRFWLSGTSPTTSLGVLMDAGDSYLITGAEDVINFKCINASGGNGAVVGVIPFF